MRTCAWRLAWLCNAETVSYHVSTAACACIVVEFSSIVCARRFMCDISVLNVFVVCAGGGDARRR